MLLVLALGQDEAFHELAAIAQEHVLGPAQADALCPHTAGPGRVLCGVGVGPYVHVAGCVRVAHEPVHGPHQIVGPFRCGVDLTVEVAHHG